MLKRIKFIISIGLIINSAIIFSVWAIKNDYSNTALMSEELPNAEMHSTKNNSLIQLHDIKDKTYFIKLFASWCSYCIKEMPYTQIIIEKYNLPVYGILYRDNLNNIDPNYRKIFKDILIEQDSEFFRKIGIKTIPDTLIVHNGQIIYHSRNSLNQKIIDNDIDKIIKYITDNKD